MQVIQQMKDMTSLISTNILFPTSSVDLTRLGRTFMQTMNVEMFIFLKLYSRYHQKKYEVFKALYEDQHKYRQLMSTQ